MRVLNEVDCAYSVSKKDLYYMNIAINNARVAYMNDDVPIGAVVVCNDYFTTGYNEKNIKKIATLHAEIVAINKMCKKNNDWRLIDTTLYVTVFPCLMCIGAIIEARINKIIFGTINEKNYKYLYILKENNITVIGPILNFDCSLLITNFFKEKR